MKKMAQKILPAIRRAVPFTATIICLFSAASSQTAEPAVPPPASAAEWVERARADCDQQKGGSLWARKVLVEGLARVGKPEEAWAVVKKSGNWAGAYLEDVVAGQGKAGDVAGAEKTIADSSDKNAKDLARHALVKALAGRGDLKAAARIAGEITDAQGKSGALVAIIAAQAAGDADAAVAAAEALPTKEAQDSARAEIARALAKAGKHDAARAIAEKIATETDFFSRSRVTRDLDCIRAAAKFRKIRSELIGDNDDAIAPMSLTDMQQKLFPCLESALAASKDIAARTKALKDAAAVIAEYKVVYPLHYRAEGWTYVTLAVASTGDTKWAKSAAAKAFESGIKDEMGGFHLTCAPTLAAVLVKLGDWDAALDHMSVIEKSKKDTGVPMAQAIGFAMIRERHGDQLLKLLPKIEDGTCRIFVCLGAAAACGK